MIFAGKKLIKIGAKNVLLKGGHLRKKNICDIFISKNKIKIFKK